MSERQINPNQTLNVVEVSLQLEFPCTKHWDPDLTNGTERFSSGVNKVAPALNECVMKKNRTFYKTNNLLCSMGGGALGISRIMVLFWHSAIMGLSPGLQLVENMPLHFRCEAHVSLCHVHKVCSPNTPRLCKRRPDLTSLWSRNECDVPAGDLFIVQIYSLNSDESSLGPAPNYHSP